MKEIRNIIAAYQKVDFEKQQAALATVVKVRGSSYRSPGARMLITDNGRWVGSISGGCLEGDALRQARKVMQSGKATIVTYDTTKDENNNLGVGLGCNGIIDVLIEPINPAAKDNPVAVLLPVIDFMDVGAMATVYAVEGNIPVQPGDKVLVHPDGKTDSTIKKQELTNQIKKKLETARNQKKFETLNLTMNECSIDIFVELLQPSINLMIFGAGFDAKPVTEFAKMLGWQITVADECIAHIAPANFPLADQVVHCQREFVDQHFVPTPYTAVVLMSHNYNYDLAALRHILKTDVSYIGILGPKKRTDKMFAELETEAFTLSKKDHQRIHSPIGLDIGAETPEEIALAIITEIQSKFTNRSGGFLKYRTGPIHQRHHANDQVFKQVYLANELELEETANAKTISNKA